MSLGSALQKRSMSGHDGNYGNHGIYNSERVDVKDYHLTNMISMGMGNVASTSFSAANLLE